MHHPNARRSGFTLAELMIAVAIIGILSATAIASWQKYQMRSKRSEAMTNLAAIAKAELAYFGTEGVYHGAVPMPAACCGPGKMVWDAASKAEFGPLGYEPEGTVTYAYDVNTIAADCACPLSASGDAMCYTASAYGDVDGDGFIAVVAYFQPDEAGGTCVTAINANPPPIDPATGVAALSRPVYIPIGPGSDDY